MKLLNIRRMFAPDPGYVIVDADLAGADSMVVAWECGDGPFKTAMKGGLKIHVESNKYLFPDQCGPDGKREPYYTEVKSCGHGTTYGGGLRTMATNLSWPEARVVKFQNYFFGRFPEIKEWHRRIDYQLQTTREVSTRFGYRIHFFGDIRGALPEALAWVPQATVGRITVKGALAIRRKFPRSMVQILLNVHDSLVLQVKESELSCLHEVREILNSISVPYEEPLQIPWNFKLSSKSWGDGHAVNWEDLRRAA